jgi:hypothetical protein
MQGLVWLSCCSVVDDFRSLQQYKTHRKQFVVPSGSGAAACGTEHWNSKQSLEHLVFFSSSSCHGQVLFLDQLFLPLYVGVC